LLFLSKINLPPLAGKGVLILKTMKRLIVLACVCVLMLSFAGCGKVEVFREVAKVNDRAISKEEFVYYLEVVKQQMLAEAGAPDIENFWDAEIDGVKASDAAKNKALEEILRVEVACIKAEEKGLALSDAQVQSIRNSVKTNDRQLKEQNKDIKDLTGMSDEQLIDVRLKSALVQLYISTLDAEDPTLLAPSDEEVQAIYQQEYVRVKHVLVKNTEENGFTSDEVKAKKKATAEEVLKKAKAGANFDTLIKDYGEDPGTADKPDGYTFTKGSMVPEFEAASFNLAVGKISELVESNNGWHIIKKYELLTSGESYDATIQTITNELKSDNFNKLLDEYKAQMEVKIHQNVINGIDVK